jgi:hypothetical protein
MVEKIYYTIVTYWSQIKINVCKHQKCKIMTIIDSQSKTKPYILVLLKYSSRI